MGLISANAIKSIANKLLKDISVTISVTYKKVSSSYSTTIRNQTETITSLSSIRALRSDYSLDEIEKSGGIIKQDDTKFTIRADALISVTIGRGDRINDGSRDWEILDYKPISVGSTAIMYSFHCR